MRLLMNLILDYLFTLFYNNNDKKYLIIKFGYP